MLRTHTCGELRIAHLDQEVTLAGWVQGVRDKGSLLWIDLRDRYGITQLLMEEEKTPPLVLQKARQLGREYVIQIHGIVSERYSKNSKIPTGDIEIKTTDIHVLNPSKTPPFTIEEHTDGGEDLRMQYRYLDLRRIPMRNHLLLRHQLAWEIRNHLNSLSFVEVETPVLIKSTPEGARDFVVPSRLNPGCFYALPQSPQVFKQLLMIAGLDRYYQIVKCFRDEDLRSDRQPEFTQIDCEMSFVTQEDVWNTFESLIRHLFKKIKNVELPVFKKLTYEQAWQQYGTDKPDLRFGMSFFDVQDMVKGKGFTRFDEAEQVLGMCVEAGASQTNKQINGWIQYVKENYGPTFDLMYIRYRSDHTFKSSIDKFFLSDDLQRISSFFSAQPGDLILLLVGSKKSIYKAMGDLRLYVAGQLGLVDSSSFSPVWITDFPLFEQDDQEQWQAVHHPFTSPHPEDVRLLQNDPGKVRALAYDLVINGIEIGGGSIRIHDESIQDQVFNLLGLSHHEIQRQFGFLTQAFRYGAPPHGGIAFGFDRICALFGKSDSIRDFIAFPKNNMGRDTMINSPSEISLNQLAELYLKIDSREAN